MDYNQILKSLKKDFVDKYPNLNLFNENHEGFLTFCQRWVKNICSTKLLWDCDHPKWDLTEVQRGRLISTFLELFQISPTLIHALVYKFMQEREGIIKRDLEVKEINVILNRVEAEAEVLNEENNSYITAVQHLSDELFGKINSPSRLDFQDYIQEFVQDMEVENSRYIIPSQESASRCSITSSRADIFAFDESNCFVLESFSPYAHLIIGWDQGANSEDSCRAVIHPKYTIIGLCDGVSNEKSSGLYSSVLTETLTKDFIFTKKNSLLFRTKIVPKAITEKLTSNENYHPSMNTFYTKTAEEVLGSLGDGKTTLLQLVIHESGLVQFHRVGDTCLWMINKDNQIIPLSIDDDIEGAVTDYVGQGMHLNTPLHSAFIKLKEGEVIFGCTDQIANWINSNQDGFSLWLEKFKTSEDIVNTNKEFLNSIADTEGDDHQTWFMYKHNGIVINSSFEPLVLDYDDSDESYIVWDNTRYERFGNRQYYFNAEKGKGIKILPSESLYSNLIYVKGQFNLPWALDYEPRSCIAKGMPRHILEMKHLSEEDGFIDLGKIHWTEGDDEAVQFFLPKMEDLLRRLRTSLDSSGVTHRDIALENMFYSKNNDSLILIDHNSIYVHGAFTGHSGKGGKGYQEEIGHGGSYGSPNMQYSSNIFHKTSHRFPLKMLEITFNIISSIDDNERYDILIDNYGGELIFSEIDLNQLFVGVDIENIVDRISQLNHNILDVRGLLQSLSYPIVYS